jgi:hypothetical protein
MSADGVKTEDDWLKQWTIPQEDRPQYTSEPWRGENRWFRSANVVCLELYRRQGRGSSDMQD